MGLGRSHHLCASASGRAGGRGGTISLHFTNVISRIHRRAVRRRDARFGTNPMTVGIPIPNEPPFIRHGHQRRGAGQDPRRAQQARESVRPTGSSTTRARPRRSEVRRNRTVWRAAHLRLHKGFGWRCVRAAGGALTGAALAFRRPLEKARLERHAYDPQSIEANGHRGVSAPKPRRSSNRCADTRLRPASTKCALPASRKGNPREKGARRHLGGREHLERNPRGWIEAEG